MKRTFIISTSILFACVCRASESDGLSVRLAIHWPEAISKRDYPVRNGIPLPKGAVVDVKQLSLTDADGKAVSAFQSIPLGYWPDGSVKWALADFPAQSDYQDSYRLTLSEPKLKTGKSPLKINETDQHIEVVTGPLKFTVRKQGGGWLNEAWLDADHDGAFAAGERIVKPGSNAFIELGYRRSEQRTQAKRQPEFEISEDQAKAMVGMYHAVGATDYQAELIEAGPSRVIICCTGTHVRDDGAAYAPYSIWISAFAGQPFLQITHTFTGNSDVRMNDTLDVGVSVCYDLNQPRFAFGTDHDALQGAVEDKQTWLIYRNADPKRWPKFDQYRPEYEIRQEQTCLEKGALPPGWMTVSDGQMSVGLIAKDLKQMYPKELLIDGRKGELIYGINPPHGGPYDWYNGVVPDEISPTGGEWNNAGTDGIGRSHDLMLVFHLGDSNEKEMNNLTALFNDPPLVQSPADWIEKTQAIGPMIVQNTKDFPDAELWFSRQGEWFYKHMNDWFKWWGDVDYGGLQCYYLPEDGHWCNLLERFGWINNGYETQAALWMAYLRTGDRRFFQMAQACARHAVDLEMALEGGGRRMFAITFGRQGDGSHNDPGGVVWGWYQTGDYRLRDGALRSVRHCRIGKDSGKSGEAAWRNLCLRIRNGVRAFEMTKDEQYRKNVKQNLNILLEYQMPNGRFKEYQKSFVMPNYGSAALIEGYELTGDPAVKDALVRYARWVCTGAGRDDNQWASRSHRRLSMALLARAYDYTGDDRFLWAIVSDLNAKNYIAERLRFVPKVRSPGTNIDYRFRDYTRPVYPGMFAQTYVEGKIMVRLPYALAALQKAGLTEQKYKQIIDTDPVGYAAPEQGRHQLRRRLKSVVVPVSLEQVANANPYSPDNYLWGSVEHHQQYETTETVFCHLPFGATVDQLGVPFALLDPEANNGNAILILRVHQRVNIPIPDKTQALHFLGHVCGNGDTNMGTVGAKYIFHFKDGSTEEIPLKNCIDYEDVRLWHLSRNAPLAQSWWPSYDYSKIRHINVWSYTPPKPLRAVELADTGLGHRFSLLAVSAETQGNQANSDIITQMNDSGIIHGEKALSFDVPHGDYELELCLSSTWPLLMTVDVDNQQVLKNVYIGGTFYGSDNRQTLRSNIKTKDKVTIRFSPNAETSQLPDIAQWQFDPSADEAAGQPPWIENDQRNQWTLHRLRLRNISR